MKTTTVFPLQFNCYSRGGLVATAPHGEKREIKVEKKQWKKTSFRPVFIGSIRK